MSSSTPKSQRVQKWILLLCSVVAVFVWGRNLLILMPDDEEALIQVEERGTPERAPRLADVYPFSFHDSTGWRDPFAPLSPRPSPSATDSAHTRKMEPPKPPPEPPPWKLAGVVWDKKSPAAILASLDGQQRVVIAKGDTLGMSRVERIDEHSVWIRHQGRSWKLALEEPGSELPR